MVLVPLLQLVPLPPLLWTTLPNRQLLVGTFELLERELPWMPISVLPRATWLSALSLLPPLAVFLGTLLLGYRERRLLCILLLGTGILSVFVGLSQVAQGPQSVLRFFEFTNQNEAVGFFANRNHFAALLYALTLFAAVWVIEAAAGVGSVERGRLDTAWMAAVAASLVVLVIILAGQAMARSRAGLVLTIVALFGAFALAVTDHRNASVGSLAKVTPAKLMMGAIILAIILVVQYALYRILQRFDVDPLQDARIVFARNTFVAAKAYMPLGSGMGTFPSVYALFEKPQDALIDVYANRAHNDVLELALEAGVVGLGLAILFVAWLAIRSVKVWRGRDLTLGGIDLSLARAATLVVGLIIGHSLVDYPLRTGAIMGLLAFACGLLVEPLSVDEKTSPPRQVRAARPRQPSNKERIPSGGVARQLREPPSLGGAEPQPSLADAEAQPSLGDTKPQHTQRWGDDVQWPSEWRAKPETSNRKPTRRGEFDS
jgi:O-antigen ligase